jgi:hypothetical protein
MRSIHASICEKLGDTLSPNGRSASHWIAELVWEVGESALALQNRNLVELSKLLEQENQSLFTDQEQELYNHLLIRIQRASFPKWIGNGEAKKIRRDDLRAWLLSEVQHVRGLAPTKAGTNLQRKMLAAHIPTTAVDNADDMRRSYRSQMLAPKYQQSEKLRAAEFEVTAIMQELLSRLDAGDLAESGTQFHSRCLTALNAIRVKYPEADLSFLQGALYSATDRCRHRFLRAEP